MATSLKEKTTKKKSKIFQPRRLEDGSFGEGWWVEKGWKLQSFFFHIGWFGSVEIVKYTKKLYLQKA